MGGHRYPIADGPADSWVSIIGMGLMFLPKEIFQGMPTILQNIFNNGLIVGTIMVIVLEQPWQQKNISKGSDFK